MCHNRQHTEVQNAGGQTSGSANDSRDGMNSGGDGGDSSRDGDFLRF